MYTLDAMLLETISAHHCWGAGWASATTRMAVPLHAWRCHYTHGGGVMCLASRAALSIVPDAWSVYCVG